MPPWPGPVHWYLTAHHTFKMNLVSSSETKLKSKRPSEAHLSSRLSVSFCSGTWLLQNKICLQVWNDPSSQTVHVALWRFHSAASKADKLISVSGLCRRWSSVHSLLTFTFTCAALQRISGVFTLKNRSFVSVWDHISTRVRVFPPVFLSVVLLLLSGPRPRRH